MPLMAVRKVPYICRDPARFAVFSINFFSFAPRSGVVHFTYPRRGEVAMYAARAANMVGEGNGI